MRGAPVRGWNVSGPLAHPVLNARFGRVGLLNAGIGAQHVVVPVVPHRRGRDRTGKWIAIRVRFEGGDPYFLIPKGDLLRRSVLGHILRQAEAVHDDTDESDFHGGTGNSLRSTNRLDLHECDGGDRASRKKLGDERSAAGVYGFLNDEVGERRPYSCVRGWRGTAHAEGRNMVVA